MWPYVILLVCPLLVQHVRVKGAANGLSSDRKNRVAMTLFWLLLLFFLMFRHREIGRDLGNYEHIFRAIAQSGWSYAFDRSAEVAYNILNKLISVLTDDFQWVMAVSAVLSTVFMAGAYRRYSEDASLSIVLFVNLSNFVFLFSGLRQAIAISLGFLAFECVRRKKWLCFLLVVTVAMLFHTSAFILLVMYPLYHARITKRWLVFVVPLLGVTMLFNESIFGVLTGILSRFTKYEAEIVSTGAYTMIVLFALFAVFSYVIPDESRLDADTMGLRNMLLFSLALQMFAPLHTIAMRMNYYYIAFIPLLLPKVIRYRREGWRQPALIARYVMVAFFVVYFFLSAPKANSLDTFPYRFMWQ